MKNKALIIICTVAALTFSFTFASITKSNSHEAKVATADKNHSEPTGGFASNSIEK
jgi:hypothetical protein